MIETIITMLNPAMRGCRDKKSLRVIETIDAFVLAELFYSSCRDKKSLRVIETRQVSVQVLSWSCRDKKSLRVIETRKAA